MGCREAYHGDQSMGCSRGIKKLLQSSWQFWIFKTCSHWLVPSCTVLNTEKTSWTSHCSQPYKEARPASLQSVSAGYHERININTVGEGCQFVHFTCHQVGWWKYMPLRALDKKLLKGFCNLNDQKTDNSKKGGVEGRHGWTQLFQQLRDWKTPYRKFKDSIMKLNIH